MGTKADAALGVIHLLVGDLPQVLERVLERHDIPDDAKESIRAARDSIEGLLDYARAAQAEIDERAP